MSSPVERLPNLPPPARYEPPTFSPAEEALRRRRAIAHVDEMLARIDDPLPEGEEEWDPATLFPPGRVR